MASIERIRCNICEIVIESDKAEEHLSSSSHLAAKAKLENGLSLLHDESTHDTKGTMATSSVGHWKDSVLH